jgi:hypothetical protein
MASATNTTMAANVAGSLRSVLMRKKRSTNPAAATARARRAGLALDLVAEAIAGDADEDEDRKRDCASCQPSSAP